MISSKMENERDRAEFKHVCKLCNKRYPSGKSLGGHMRSHVIANAQKAKALLKNKAPTFDPPHFDHDDDEDDDKNAGAHSGYGLRENPKKTWRATDHSVDTNNANVNVNVNVNQERVCKQCGKAFQSLKALCGHMSSHSERERNFKEEDEDDLSWSSETQNNNNNNNDLDSLSSKRQTRSSYYSRYRSNTAVESLSNNSEIDYQEQEEVAISLMMLSRDSSSSVYKPNCFNFTAESSDNNSVILDLGKRKDLTFKKVGQEMDNSDSGYFENGAKELESDDSVDGYFVKNYYYYSKNPKVEFGSEGSKKRVRVRVKDVGGFSFDSPESENSYKKMKQDWHQKTHQSSLDTSNSNKNPTSSKAVAATNYAKKGIVSKKAKGHKCPYCPKVFKSGQALGGHKRSHMMGGGGGGMVTEEKLRTRAPPPEPESEEKPLIDLNLPAPVEEEASGNSQSVAW